MGSMTVRLTSVRNLKKDNADIATPEQVRARLEGGKDLFNPITCEYVFYDKDFDDETTFGISKIDLTRVKDGNIFEGYSASNDYSVDRDEICKRIASENGWSDISTEHVRTLFSMRAGEVEAIAGLFEREPNREGVEDYWVAATDSGYGIVGVPRRGEKYWEDKPGIKDVPMLAIISADMKAIEGWYKYPSVRLDDGCEREYRMERGVDLPRKVRIWAAEMVMQYAWKNALAKDGPTVEKRFAL